MALVGMRMTLNLDVVLNHMPQDRYGIETRVFLRKGRGESLDHVVMKLLSYLLFYHEDLRIEASANQHYKPDLLRLGDHLQPVQWVDCGQTSIRKLDVISRRNHDTFIEIIKPTPGALQAYHLQAHPRLARAERVRFWSFDSGLVSRLCETLHGRHTLHATVTSGYESIFLLIDEQIELRAGVVYMGEHVIDGAL